MIYKELSEKKQHSQKFLRDKIDFHSKIIQKKRYKNSRFSKTELTVKKKTKRKRNKTDNEQRLALAKERGPDETAINLSCLNLASPQN